MQDIYYKQLIEKYGLWYSPKQTAKIIIEAHLYHKPGVLWKDIAKEVGISASALSRIVSGTGFPRREIMKKLIEYFDLVA